MALKYRPDNPFCHPIRGKPFSVKYLACRVERTADGNVSGAEITGTVESIYRFREMADFQFNLPADDSLMQTHAAMENFNVEYMEKFKLTGEFKANTLMTGDARMVPPPIFSRQETPFEYNFLPEKSISELNAGKVPDAENMRVQLKAHRTKTFDSVTTIPFTKPPRTEPPVTFVKTNESSENQALISKLRSLFDNRPVWLRHAIDSEMGVDEGSRLLTRFLPLVAFYYSSGPFRTCWVRLGFNVAASKDTRIYQLMDIRMSANNSTKPTTRRNYKFIGTEDAAHSFATYQLCDLEYPMLKTLVNRNDNLLDNCDSKSGWYSLNHLALIRRVIRLMLDTSERVSTKSGLKKPFAELSQQELDYLEQNVISQIPDLPPKRLNKNLQAAAAKRKEKAALVTQVDGLMQRLEAVNQDPAVDPNAMQVVSDFDELAGEAESASDAETDGEYDLFDEGDDDE